MNLKKHLTAFSLFLWGISALAQTPKGLSVSGKLLDESNREPIGYASAVLYALPDTTMITGVITDDKGGFSFDGVKPGKYLLRTSFVGYKTLERIVEVSGTPLHIDNPLYMTSSIELDEVVVTGTVRERQVTAEKTKVNVSKSAAQASGNIMDVLRAQPGVSMDADENIYLRGNKNILVLIDGVPTTMSGLNSIPSSNVDNIEIITSPSVKYDAEGTGGIINIVTRKKNSMQGLSGRATLNYGLTDEFNGGVNLQYRKGIWGVDFGYNGKHDPNTIKSELTREIHASDMKLMQQVLAEQVNSVHNAQMLITANPTKKDIFTLNVKTMFPKLTNEQDIQGIQFIEDNRKHFDRRNKTTFSRKVVESSFNYKRIFEKGHELSLDAAFSRTKGDRPAHYYIGGVSAHRSSGGGAPTNATLQADYLKSVGEYGQIEAGVKGFKRWNNFLYEFSDYDLDNHQWIENRAFSNDLEHSEYIASAYLMYSDRLSDKWSYKAGARLEYSTSSLHQKSIGERIEKDFWHPFPFLSLQYRMNEKHQFDLSFNRRITRPAYPQLNPIIYVVDHTFHETGNKDLNPEVADKFELNYTFHKKKGHFTAGIYFSSTKDYITQVTHLASPENLVLTYANGERDRQVGVTIDMGGSLFPWFSMTRAFTLFYTRTSGIYNGMSLHTEDVGFSTNSTITVKFDKHTEADVFLNLVSAIDRPQFKLRPVTYGNVTLKRRFMQGRLTASITLTDVLNSDKWRSFSRNNTVYTLQNYSKGETRKLFLGLTYNFNSFQMNKKMQPKSGTEDNSHIRLGQ